MKMAKHDVSIIKGRSQTGLESGQGVRQGCTMSP